MSSVLDRRIVIGRIRSRPRPEGWFEPASTPIDQTGLTIKAAPSPKLSAKLDSLQSTIRTALIVAAIIAALGLGALAMAVYMSRQKPVPAGTRYRPKAKRPRQIEQRSASFD